MFKAPNSVLKSLFYFEGLKGKLNCCFIVKEIHSLQKTFFFLIREYESTNREITNV